MSAIDKFEQTYFDQLFDEQDLVPVQYNRNIRPSKLTEHSDKEGEC